MTIIQVYLETLKIAAIPRTHRMIQTKENRAIEIPDLEKIDVSKLNHKKVNPILA